MGAMQHPMHQHWEGKKNVFCFEDILGVWYLTYPSGGAQVPNMLIHHGL